MICNVGYDNKSGITPHNFRHSSSVPSNKKTNGTGPEREICGFFLEGKKRKIGEGRIV